jgi:predicted DNA-binding protein (MmcQ/YjbR family)
MQNPWKPHTSYKRLGAICERLPEVEMKPFGGHVAPAWRVRDKIFCATGQTERPRMNVKGAPGAQAALVGSDPERFYVPAYTGSKGWVGVWLDGDLDWDEIAELVGESYRLIAPKRLVALLDA